MADPTSRTGTRYAPPEVVVWLDQLHAPHDVALGAAFDAPTAAGMPAIQVGRSEGKLLGLLLRLVGARKVVEVGTLAGYSAIHMARALGEGGRLWTLENSPRHHAIAEESIARAGLADKVTCLLGDALDLLPALAAEGPFDAVFIDADKGNYDHYGAWAIRHLRPGGLVIGDNAYFFGDLLDDDPRAGAMRRFHQLVAERCESVCIPTPDGLVVGIVR
jgi:caffeoyl-CoA O-methyltransferase